MIEVFKTNVQKTAQAKKLIAFLLQHFPGYKINVDLHDCDKILRVEAAHVVPATIVRLVKEYGHVCSVLE